MEDNSNSQGGCQPVSPQPATQSAMGIIYKITNTVDGKIYVGQTRQKLNRRISGHKSSKKKTGIDAAIKKYGWENFSVEVIEECPVEQLSEREIIWIAELNAKGLNGYNLTDGGDGGGSNPSEETRARISANHADVSGEKNPFYGKKHSKETRAVMSSAKKGKSHKPHTKETRDKISVGNKGKHSHNKGKHLPESQKAKMSVARKAWWARKKAVENGGNK